jgi:hypothetical protein
LIGNRLGKIVILVSALVILLITVPSTQSSSFVSITVHTDKTSYQVGENIEVYGNLTYKESPVEGALVTVEVTNPSNDITLVRVFETDSYGGYNTSFRIGSDTDLGMYTVTATVNYVEETATGSTTFILFQVINTTIMVGGQNYLISIESNATMTDLTATENVLNFVGSGPSGQRGYVNITFPVGLNQTAIRVWVEDDEVIPPPFPIITTNSTHYFIYFEFPLSTHNIAVQYAVPSVQSGGGGGGRMPYSD